MVGLVGLVVMRVIVRVWGTARGGRLLGGLVALQRCVLSSGEGWAARGGGLLGEVLVLPRCVLSSGVVYCRQGWGRKEWEVAWRAGRSVAMCIVVRGGGAARGGSQVMRNLACFGVVVPWLARKH